MNTRRNLSAALLGAAMSLSAFPVFASELETAPMSLDGKPQIVEEDADLSALNPKDALGLYRMYNPNSGEHFYTCNLTERDHLVDVGWTQEGIGWNVPLLSDDPVFRLYNPNAGDHHYTLDETEAKKLVALGWVDEGIGWYSAKEGLPVYRQYNPNAAAGSHNYTPDENENKYLGEHGWRLEGIGWTALELSAPAGNVMRDLQNQLVTYQNDLESARLLLDFGSLSMQARKISEILNSLKTTLPDRSFVYQNGELKGYSPEKSSRISVPNLAEGLVLVYQPAQKKLILAEAVENEALSGKTVAAGGGLDSTLLKGTSGTMENGLFTGDAISASVSGHDGDWVEQMACGTAAGNLMNGTIRMHTHHFIEGFSDLDDYLWSMDVDNGTAKYVRQGDQYVLYDQDGQRVYVDYEPVNWKFWSEQWTV